VYWFVWTDAHASVFAFLPLDDLHTVLTVSPGWSGVVASMPRVSRPFVLGDSSVDSIPTGLRRHIDDSNPICTSAHSFGCSTYTHSIFAGAAPISISMILKKTMTIDWATRKSLSRQRQTMIVDS
jgi:hypothetical protein